MIHELIEAAGVMGEVVELIGIFIIIAGFVYAFFLGFIARKEKSETRVDAFRSSAKRSMMLGLDFLVAGDIIRTVTVNQTLEGVATLGLLVLVRIVLAFAIHVETEGRWPWQKNGGQC